MKKRKMPNHIVLPNGMWRFIKGKASSVSKAVKRKVRRTRKARVQRITGVKRMARRRRSFSRRGRSSGLGLGGISLKGILVGAGGAEIADNMGVTGIIPYGNYVAGAGAGKLAKTGMLSGLIGAVARDMLKGNLLGNKGSNFGGAY